MRLSGRVSNTTLGPVNKGLFELASRQANKHAVFGIDMPKNAI